MKRFLLLIPFAILAILILAWSQRRSGPPTVSGLVEAHDIRLGSRVGGRVREVLVGEGERAKAGDVLVRLEPYDLQERFAEAENTRAAQATRVDRLKRGFRPEEIEQARALRDRAKAVLDKLDAGPRPIEFQISRDKVAAAEADERKAEYDYAKFREMRERNEATSDEMAEKTRLAESTRARAALARDELKFLEEGPRKEDIAEATAALANAAATFAMIEKGYRVEEVAEAEATLKAAESRVDAIRRQVAELEVRAPCDGVVEALSLRPGDLVGSGAPVMTFLDLSSLWIRTYVPQNRVALKVGQLLSIRVDAFPDRKFSGKIVYISQDAEFTPSNAQTPEERAKQVFRMKVELGEGRELLRPGMAADVVLE